MRPSVSIACAKQALIRNCIGDIGVQRETASTGVSMQPATELFDGASAPDPAAQDRLLPVRTARRSRRRCRYLRQ